MSASSPLPSLVAHRGASGDAPENTLSSARLAWRQGADAVELDVHLTADRQVVVIHDDDTRRTTGKPGLVAELTLAEIKRLDAGSWRSPSFAGERVPTLQEMFAVTPPGKQLFVELKSGPEIVPEIAQVLAQAGAAAPAITFISFDLAALRAAKRRFPDHPALLLAKSSKGSALIPLISTCRDCGFAGLDLESNWPLSPREVDWLRQAGLELHVWTVDDPRLAKSWAELGAVSLTTNRPGWLRQKMRSGDLDSFS